MSSDGARDTQADAVFRVMLRPIASSLPLGFFAFTAGTVLLTAIELGWVPETDTRRSRNPECDASCEQ